MSENKPPLRVFVSSTVYGHQDVLSQIFAMLKAYGYEVWMSHAGTVPVNPTLNNTACCLEAVDLCDVFLGIIFPNYGSGVIEQANSITHQEIERAVSNKPLRFFSVKSEIEVARQLLKQFRFDEDGKKKDHKFFKPTSIIDDIRVIDMYECALRHEEQPSERVGHWVQNFRDDPALLEFIVAQFKSPERLREILKGTKHD